MTTASYFVTKICDHAGTVTFEAIPAAEYKKREKAAYDGATEAYKSWVAAKKDAATSGTAFTDAAPKKPVLVYQRVAGKAQADNMVAVLRERWEAAQQKRTEGKEAADTDKKDSTQTQ